MIDKVRWESVKKTDPETNEQYWSREQVTIYKAEEHDRVNAVLDILKGVTTAEEVRKKYDITSINSTALSFKPTLTTKHPLPDSR